MKNVAFKLMGSLLLVVYGEDPPTYEDHLACLALFRSMDIEGSRSLCFTSGGGPTAAQRKDLHDVLTRAAHSPAQSSPTPRWSAAW